MTNPSTLELMWMGFLGIWALVVLMLIAFMIAANAKAPKNPECERMTGEAEAEALAALDRQVGAKR